MRARRRELNSQSGSLETLDAIITGMSTSDVITVHD